jgi:hypothetical protein
MAQAGDREGGRRGDSVPRRLGDPATGFGVPRAQFTVARVKRDILKRSSVGAMFVNRQGATSATGTRYNRSAGIDAEFNLTDHYLIKAFLMGTATPGVRSSFLSRRVDSRFENNRFRFITVYEDIGSNFNPEVGFAERTGIHQYFGQAAYKPPQVHPRRAADGVRDAARILHGSPGQFSDEADGAFVGHAV